ncbi:hypothetical protein, partial [Phormidium sp. CCY1219]|uniref:hypothetical protein n=1 Tax=Phormidium sp. CCY1219 TaxID=2886104 RepID=UPI002D1E8A92
LGFRPLEGDSDRFNQAIARATGARDTKSDLLALLLNHLLEVCDRLQIDPKEAIARIFQK